MDNFIFVFFAILVTTTLAYLFYKIILSADKKNKEYELQITSDEILQQLNILCRQKKYNIVESLAQNYLAKRSGNNEVRMILARSFYDTKRYFDAIEQAKLIVKHQSDNQDCKIFLANCYEAVGKNQQAIGVLQELLSVNPNNIVAIKNLAKIFYSTNQKISAINMYNSLNKFLESNQEKVNNMMIIAELHRDLKEYDAAIEWYSEVLGIYPDEKEAKKSLIELYFFIPDYEKIIQLSEELRNVSSKGEEFWALDMLKQAYLCLEDYDKALDFALLIKENPVGDKIEAEQEIAKILLLKEQMEDGIEILKSLIEQEPENIGIRKDLASAYEKIQDFNSAVSVYKGILEKVEPDEVEQVNIELSNLYSNWGMYLFLDGENEECFKRFTIALKYFSENADIYYKLGQVNKTIKNFNEAISHFRRAIELNPANTEYYYSLAQCYEAIDSIYEQKKVLTESLKYKTDNANVYYKLGLIFQQQNDLTAAIFNMETAVQLKDSFIEAKIKLALLYENKGYTEGAIQLYESVLKEEPENEAVINNLKMLKG